MGSAGSGESQDGTSQGENSQQHQHQQFLGDASGAIPNFDAVEVDKDLPEGITQEDVDMFEHLYQQHCEVGILRDGWWIVILLNNLYRETWFLVDNIVCCFIEEEFQIIGAKL